MALIYQTTLQPSKLEVLAEWLPRQHWFTGDAAQLVSIGAYRFDDPEGEVGMEGHLLTAGEDVVYHVPVSYRGAPLSGGEAFLAGTTEHGVLGTRWITDAIGDPVYRAVVADTIAIGGSEVAEFVPDADGVPQERARSTHLRGSGGVGGVAPELTAVRVSNVAGVSRAEAPGVALEILRRPLDEYVVPEGARTLTATWPGQEQPRVVAVLHG